MTLENTITQAFDLVLKNRDGDTPFMLLFQEKDDSKLVAANPVPDFMLVSGAGKDILAETISKVCEMLKPFAYVIIMEAWFLERIAKAGDDIDEILQEQGSIRDHPQRMECIMICAGGRDRTVARAWKIHRNEAGARMGLEKLPWGDGGAVDQFVGRFADLNLDKSKVQ